jgi:hypothetical protein
LPGLPLLPGKPTCSLFRGPLRACLGRECPPALRLAGARVRFFGEKRTPRCEPAATVCSSTWSGPPAVHPGPSLQPGVQRLQQR